MAINWNYNKNTEKPTFKPIPVGNYRCRIEEANEKVSQNNNEMIELVFSFFTCLLAHAITKNVICCF